MKSGTLLIELCEVNEVFNLFGQYGQVYDNMPIKFTDEKDLMKKVKNRIKTAGTERFLIRIKNNLPWDCSTISLLDWAKHLRDNGKHCVVLCMLSSDYNDIEIPIENLKSKSSTYNEIDGHRTHYMFKLLP